MIPLSVYLYLYIFQSMFVLLINLQHPYILSSIVFMYSLAHKSLNFGSCIATPLA